MQATSPPKLCPRLIKRVGGIWEECGKRVSPMYGANFCSKCSRYMEEKPAKEARKQARSLALKSAYVDRALADQNELLQAEMKRVHTFGKKEAETKRITTSLTAQLKRLMEDVIKDVENAGSPRFSAPQSRPPQTNVPQTGAPQSNVPPVAAPQLNVHPVVAPQSNVLPVTDPQSAVSQAAPIVQPVPILFQPVQVQPVQVQPVFQEPQIAELVDYQVPKVVDSNPFLSNLPDQLDLAKLKIEEDDWHFDPPKMVNLEMSESDLDKMNMEYFKEPVHRAASPLSQKTIQMAKERRQQKINSKRFRWTSPSSK